MNLVVDIGNSRVKAALFDEGRLVELFEGARELENLPHAERTIVVSTRGNTSGFNDFSDFTGVLKLDDSTPVPVKNLYGTPETLGYDRLAAAVGAHAMFPEKTVLVVDFGTAITFDIVTVAGEYLGGNISPGAGMRFRALSEFTESLPLVALETGSGRKPGPEEEKAEFPAKTTGDAIRSGVVKGIVAETESYIEEVRRRYGEIETIFTGGDADYFAGRVKFPIFAVSELVLYGLNAILEHNANL